MNFTFTLDRQSIVIDHDNTTGYDWIRYPGLTSPLRAEWEGAPMLPAIQKPVLLPEGRRVARLLVVLGDPVDLPEPILPPPTPPAREDSTSDWIPDPIYYQDGQLFPPSPQVLTSNESFREFRIASFLAMPFEWRGDTRTLRFYQTVDVKLTLEDVPTADRLPRRLRPERRYSQDGWEMSWIAENVLNPEDLGPLYPTGTDPTLGFTYAVVESTETPGFHPTDRPSLEGPPVEMVIVTADVWANGQGNSGDMATSFQKLADWRTKTGRPTVVRTLGWIRGSYPGSDDPEKIRNFLKEAYSLWGTDYLILGGDHRAVPTRIMVVTGTSQDPPSDWYYAALDGTWNSERDATFNWLNVNGASDNFPDLWVGRLPARDVADANVMVTKILTYERCPDGGYPVPSSSYYTRAVTAAGLTNSGDWNPSGLPSSTKWTNGIFMAEEVKKQVFDNAAVLFTTQRLYPNLTGTVATCYPQSLDCYDKIRNAILPYPPGPLFTPQNLHAELNGNPGSSFFHMEHSFPHLLGGPVDPGWPPNKDTCLYTQNCGPGECTDWAGACLALYNANNGNAHFNREWVEKLSNGPAYFVGMSNGSLTARHELDAVDETLLRDPDGGAVSMCGKSLSTSYNVPDNGDHLDICVNYFKNSLISRKFVGVALSNAVSGLVQGGGSPEANRAWHLMGDPTLRAWSEAPTAMSTSIVPATLGSPGIKKFDITVTDTGTGLPVNQARVCLYRQDNVYATTLTKSNGVATFPAVLLMNVADSLHVYVTADNRLPKHSLILGGGASIEARGLTYFGHSWVDTLDVGAQTDFAEAGDQISMGLELKANSKVGAGSIKVAASPRVRSTVRFGASQTFDASRVYIGKNNANPPAAPDTFNLHVNENAIRPEDSPTTNPGANGLVWIWRDSDFLYHVKAKYAIGEPVTRYRIVFQADGGMEWVGQTIEPADTVIVTPGSIDCRLYPDGTDDEVTFRAEAKDWIEWVTNTDTYAPRLYGQIAVCHVRTKLLAATPPRKRINMTIWAGLYSDFYIDVHAPDVDLTFLNPPTLHSSTCPCIAPPGLQEWYFYPTLLNKGDAVADSVEVRVTLTPPTFVGCPSNVWHQINPGAEATTPTPLAICTLANNGTFTPLEIRRKVNGAWQALRTYASLNPWGHTREMLWARVDPTLGGFRVSWSPPTDTTGIRGYHVFMDSAGVQTKLRTDLKTHATQWTVRNRSKDHIYKFGVAAIDANFTRGPITWTLTASPNFPERPNWPKRVLRGSATSVTLVNIDGDAASEIIVGGKTIVAWNGDGTTATTDLSGLVYDPYGTSNPTGETVMSFNGALAAHDIDNDGTVEIVGAYGDGYVYCVEADGGPYEWRVACPSQSGPTIANLDRVGNYEVILNSYPDCKVYVFNANGTGYRCTDGLFADVGDPAMQYSFAGVAVGDLDNDAAHTLEIVQASRAGRVHVWKSVGWSGCTGLPPELWNQSVSTNAVPLSTPIVTRIPLGTGTPMVMVAASGAYRRVTTMVGTTGAIDESWVLSNSYPGSSCEFFGADASPVAVPSVADFHNPPDGNPEIAWPTWVYHTTGCPSHAYDPKTHLATLTKYGSVTTKGVAADSLPLPGRRLETYAKTIGQPILGDIDGDGKTEILAVSNQGALFCWEARWDTGTNTFSYVAEKGWPIVFDEQPAVVAVGEIDGTDASAELVVATDDGYVHTYDLPGLSTGSSQPWSMYAHDARRTGNSEGGGSGPVQDQGPDGDVTIATRPDLSKQEGPLRPGEPIEFQIPGPSDVELSVYDVSGRRVRRLVDQWMPGGAHEVRWSGSGDDGHRVSSGVYFLRLDVGDFEVSRRIVWLR